MFATFNGFIFANELLFNVIKGIGLGLLCLFILVAGVAAVGAFIYFLIKLLDYIDFN